MNKGGGNTFGGSDGKNVQDAGGGDRHAEGLMSQDLIYNSTGFITDIMARTLGCVESQDSQIL